VSPAYSTTERALVNRGWFNAVCVLDILKKAGDRLDGCPTGTLELAEAFIAARLLQIPPEASVSRGYGTKNLNYPRYTEAPREGLGGMSTAEVNPWRLGAAQEDVRADRRREPRWSRRGPASRSR
jgi:hypothetical protein